MADITVFFKDGTSEHFPETTRAGGSWRTTYKIEEGWVIIEDAYGNQTLFPSSSVKRIGTSNNRPSW